MPYIDGFVLAVPTAHRQQFVDHAKKANSVFLELGATRIRECQGDDVKVGKQTDFRRAVEAKDDERVVFMDEMDEMMKDPRMDPAKNPMPFDSKRMIFGGFVPVVELGTKG